MNKTELITQVAEKSGLTKKDSTQAVEAVFESITEELAQGGEFSLIGFGKFSTSVRAARTARNPKSGEPIDVPEKVVPKFKAGKALKEQVSQGS